MGAAGKLAPDAFGPTITMGEILAEFAATSLGQGFLEILPLVGPFPSGAPAIFINQCASFGGSGAMIGSVGDDDFGQINLQRMKRNKVDTTAVSVHSSLPTGTAFVRYQQDGQRDFVFNMWTSAAGTVSWTAEVEAVVKRAGHLHIMGTMLTYEPLWRMVERAAHIIKTRGGTISLDPNLRKELKTTADIGQRFQAMLDLTDLVLPSGEELFLAAGLPVNANEQAALDTLFSLGVTEVVLKRGERGSSCYRSDGSVEHASAFVIDEVDPTGAGDCFGGAYVACRRLGMPITESLTYANAAGASNASVCGAMEGVASREQLDQFIANTERR